MHKEEMDFDPYATPYTKIKLRWIDLNLKDKLTELLDISQLRDSNKLTKVAKIKKKKT